MLDMEVRRSEVRWSKGGAPGRELVHPLGGGEGGGLSVLVQEGRYGQTRRHLGDVGLVAEKDKLSVRAENLQP